MNILVIFTGGTIGSTLADGWITPNDSTRYTLISTYRKTYGDQDIAFTSRAPYSILSENLSAESLSALTAEVLQATTEDFDGIIVTHGTDTLQYAGAALGFATGNDCIPTVLVSSNFPLEDKRSNGNENFKAAVEFIKAKSGRGVFIAYKNGNDAVTFHNALCATTHGEADDAVYSLYGAVYAAYTADGIHVCGKSEPCEKLPATFKEASDILVVDIHPGDGYHYPLTDYRAVILRPYHSGTLNTASSAFIAFCERAKAKGIPVYAVNIPKGTTYASSKRFGELGITPLYDTTFASAFVKLWMQLS